MRHKIVVWLAGMLLFIAFIAHVMTISVYGDRGRDEINLFSIHEFSVETGGVVTQPIPLQRDEAYAIELPYRWLGSSPARLEERLIATDGSLLSDTTQTLHGTQAPFWLQPIADGSLLQDHNAALHTVRIPAGATGTVILRLERVDQTSGALVLFASDRVSPPPGADLGSQPDLRPTMIERPTEILTLETEYGAPRPAITKTPVFVSRVQSLAPPWLPFPLPEALFAGIVILGLFLYTRILFAPEEEPLSATRSR